MAWPPPLVPTPGAGPLVVPPWVQPPEGVGIQGAPSAVEPPAQPWPSDAAPMAWPPPLEVAPPPAPPQQAAPQPPAAAPEPQFLAEPPTWPTEPRNPAEAAFLRYADADAKMAEARANAAVAATAMQRQAIEEQQRQQADYSARLAEEEAAIGEEVQRVAAQRVNPAQVWEDAPGWAVASSLIGAAIGGYLETRYGRPNVALQLINQTIDRNIAAQRDNIQQQRGELNDRMNLYYAMRQRFGNDLQAEAATRAAMLDAVIREGEAQAMRLAPGMARDKALMQLEQWRAAARDAVRTGASAGASSQMASDPMASADAPVVGDEAIYGRGNAGLQFKPGWEKEAREKAVVARELILAVRRLRAAREAAPDKTFDGLFETRNADEITRLREEAVTAYSKYYGLDSLKARAFIDENIIGDTGESWANLVQRKGDQTRAIEQQVIQDRDAFLQSAVKPGQRYIGGWTLHPRTALPVMPTGDVEEAAPVGDYVNPEAATADAKRAGAPGKVAHSITTAFTRGAPEQQQRQAETQNRIRAALEVAAGKLPGQDTPITMEAPDGTIRRVPLSQVHLYLRRSPPWKVME